MIISGIGNWKVMGSIKICDTNTWFFKVLNVCLLIILPSLYIIMAKVAELCVRKPNTAFCFVVLSVVSILSVIFSCYSLVWWLPKLILRRRKLIMNKNISKADDLFPNIASMIPSVDEVDFLEGKVLRYFKDIKKALISSFNCEICFMASGSVPERFGVPLVDDWISNNWSIRGIHALLLSDLDFLIVPSGITASYSAPFRTIDIVQSESFIEDGFAKLRVSTCTSGKGNLKEGFLSTDTIKKLVLRCISEVPLKAIPGRDKVHGKYKELKIHGPAIQLLIEENQDIIFLADFTFAIPCFEWPPGLDWPSREKMWPNQTVVTTIKKRGFHFVPKNQKNDKSMLTWRYSFSVAERELSKEINEIARKCFFALK